MVKNEAGKFYDLNLTICFLTSEKHSFGVHTDKSLKICTHVEQTFLYKTGLLLNIDVAVPSLKSKNIAKNCVSIQCTPHCQGVSVSPTNQMPAFILIEIIKQIKFLQANQSLMSANTVVSNNLIQNSKILAVIWVCFM